MTLKQPKKVYRYQGFNDQTIEALCHDQLYFSDPAAFNDPMDCQPSVTPNSDTHELRSILHAQISQRVENEALSSLKIAQIEGKEAAEHSKKIANQAAQNELQSIKYHATNPDYEMSIDEAERHLLTFAIQKELLKRSDRGVCSFSSAIYNPLLWSHYGDQHRGFAVGYTLDRKPKPILRKVEYGGARSIPTSLISNALIQNEEKALNTLDRDVFLRKASPWRYEREWRLLANRGIQDSVLALKDITFGLRCPKAVIHAVISAIDSRTDKINFYQIYQVRGSFQLKRELIELGELGAYFPRVARSGIEVFGSVEED